jgi:pyruvate-formate lyase-activating enzyme
VVILDLMRAIQPLADGRTVRFAIESAEDHAVVAAWCETTGNTLVGGGPDFVEVRRGRSRQPQDRLPADRRPGGRLWMYTNFDCNLACDYCCVRSSPTANRRALALDVVRQLVAEAVPAGVTELYLTGGEPFVLPEIGELVEVCARALPTTLLTNGMLFKGRRLETLRTMPRENFALQISLDSAEPGSHDLHRGRGSWRRACEGIETALGFGFRVRIATTLTPDVDELDQETAIRALCDRLGIGPEDRIIRRQAKRGLAVNGLVLTPESLVPEVTVTADGIYWHPVGADDRDMLVSPAIFPLSAAIQRVRGLQAEQFVRARTLGDVFVCA